MALALRWSPISRRLTRIISTLAADRRAELNLCNSKIKDLSHLGRVDDARKVFDEMPQRSDYTWHNMISAYSQNGMVTEAHSLLDAFPYKKVRSYTIVISGYAKQGRMVEAHHLFDAMPERNAVAWNAMISGYARNGDVTTARRLFDAMPERNTASWNSMITGYCHVHQMAEARGLFEEMGERDLVSWTVMISGYVQIHSFKDAWGVFRRMHCNGVSPDQSNYAAALSAVAGLGDLEVLENLRTLGIKTDFEGDVVIGTAFLDAYTRCSGGLDSAFRFFSWMRERNEYTFSAMINAFTSVGRLSEALDVYKRDPDKSIATQTALLTGFAQNDRTSEARHIFNQISNPSVVSWNAMIAGYAQNGMIDEARELFNRMPVRNAISWAAMVSGCARNGNNVEALELLAELHRCGALPSPSSFTSGFFACSTIGAIELGKQLHSLAIKGGSQFNTYVSNGLITMYAKCRNMKGVHQVFKRMRVRDTVSWNSLIVALSENDLLDDAQTAFEKMPIRDTVSWTSMISAYVQAEQGDKALDLFRRMTGEGLSPNPSTLACLISTCGDSGATELVRQIHSLAFKLGVQEDIFVGNALITTYFNCGSTESFSVFREMAERDIITWNSLLVGCAQNGFGREAVELFEQMRVVGIRPNHITFVGLLNACSHAGLVDEGWQYFELMSTYYDLAPQLRHYACMVDLLGRAGKLQEAEAFIENMPIEPDSVVWGALLGACRIHRNVEIGKRVAERLFQMEPEKAGNYVLLSNIYASLKMWDEVEELRKLMRHRGAAKQMACSWLKISNKTHYFITGDRSHERIQEIHATLKELYSRLKSTGYVPDTEFVLHDVEEEQKENALLYHSEKLAVAYGLLITHEGIPIQIIKNLRICGDCHTFFKFVSMATGREIYVRDGRRFHHFRDGFCTCGDYW